MIMCAYKTVGKGYKDGEGVGSPPGHTLGGERKCRSGTKKHSYITIRNVD